MTETDAPEIKTCDHGIPIGPSACPACYCEHKIPRRYCTALHAETVGASHR